MTHHISTDALSWYQQLIERFYQAVHVLEPDNYDHLRHGENGRNQFQMTMHRDFFALFTINFTEFFTVRGWLQDQQSRDLFDLLILFKLAGHLHVRLPKSNADYWRTRNRANDFYIGETGETTPYGKLQMFSLPFEQESAITVKCKSSNIAFSFLIGQYYFEREGVRIQPSLRDTVLDLGACLGDTALAFAASVGEKGFVHTFDFMPAHKRIINENLTLNPRLAGRIKLHEFAVGDRDFMPAAIISHDSSVNPGARVDPNTTPMRSIDSMVDTGDINTIDFIKMDIEGYELQALQGAANSLRRFRPKLAISLYHRPGDFVTIPKFLHSLELGYKFYLDHYTIHSEETVLYAIAQ